MRALSPGLKWRFNTESTYWWSKHNLGTTKYKFIPQILSQRPASVYSDHINHFLESHLMVKLPVGKLSKRVNEYLKQADWALNIFAFQISLVKQEACLQPVCMTDGLASSPLGHHI